MSSLRLGGKPGTVAVERSLARMVEPLDGVCLAQAFRGRCLQRIPPESLKYILHPKNLNLGPDCNSHRDDCP
jgi:hypothetical protein